MREVIKNIYDYFENLEQKKLPRDKYNNLIYDNDRVAYINTDSCDNRSITIDDTPYFMKGYNGDCSIVDIASTNMHNCIGIPTPPITTVVKRGEDKARSQIFLATQDVHSVDDFLFSIANNMLSKKDFDMQRFNFRHKWSPLYDMEIKKLFLKYMTEECFDDLIGLFLVDELRTEQDRHENNYFFYKSKKAEKFEGVLPIDNELLSVISREGKSKQDFINFLHTPTHTVNLFGEIEKRTHKKRIEDIKELIYDQLLSRKQIELLKRAINYDLPAEIKKVFKNPLLSGTTGIFRSSLDKYKRSDAIRAYDCISRLWEYNQKELGSDLEL